MKRIVAFLAVAGLLAAMAATVYTVYADTATVIVTSDSLSVTPANVTLSTVVLDGSDKISTSPYTSNAWTAEDARGTGAGWNVTIEATDFSDGASHTIDISQSDQEFRIQIQDANITVIYGNTKPTSSVTSMTAIPTAGGTPLKIVSAATNTGMGSYNIPPAFELMVRAETVAATYTSTITVAINTGP
jgi:hypothetical protein